MRLLSVLLLVAVMGAGASKPAALDVTPQVSLIDSPLQIRVLHATPGAVVTIELHTQIYGNEFVSEGRYTVGRAGTAIADPVTLFGSMHVAGAFRDAPFDPLSARSVRVEASNAGVSITRTVRRIVLAPGITRSEVREPSVYGTAFMHDGKIRRAAVIVLPGSEGGVPEERAALIASHGFNTLALAYFGAGPLPQALANIPIERVQNAIMWLRQRPNVDADRLGILGGSKGAELALVAASHFPELRAVVALKPSSVVFSGLFYEDSHGEQSSWTFHGVELPFANGAVPNAVKQQIAEDEKAKRPVSYAGSYTAYITNATNLRESTIPVERINGPVLLVSGDDDRLWPSSYMAQRIMQRLQQKRHPFADRWLHYSAAGHGFGEAYDTYAHSVTTGPLDLGGTAEGNERASVSSWPRVIAFLASALAQSPTPAIVNSANLLYYK